ncbi:DNA polymerase III subunit beta [Elusimicrobiota bacterium]
MKIKIYKEDLLRAVHIVQNVVGQRATLPILSNYLLEATKTPQRLLIASTNLETGIKSYVPANVIEEGSITIPAKKLGEILQNIPTNGSSSEIELELKENNVVKIAGHKSRFNISGIPKEDYPSFPQLKKEDAIKINPKKLAEMIKRVSFCVSTDDTRRILTGILMHVKNKKITLVATDGRRLAVASWEEREDLKEFKVAVPVKAMIELVRVIESNEAENLLLIDVTSGQIGFNIGDTSIFSRLIEGEYPNWEQVVPKQTQIKLSLPTNEMLAVTKRAALCISEKAGGCKYKFAKKKASVSAKTSGFYDFEGEFDLSSYDGPEGFEIYFIPNHIVDFLKVVSGDEFILGATSNVTPVIFRPKNNEEYFCVIVPMRLENA